MSLWGNNVHPQCLSMVLGGVLILSNERYTDWVVMLLSYYCSRRGAVSSNCPFKEGISAWLWGVWSADSLHLGSFGLSLSCRSPSGTRSHSSLGPLASSDWVKQGIKPSSTQWWTELAPRLPARFPEAFLFLHLSTTSLSLLSSLVLFLLSDINSCYFALKVPI